jgi:hypothetical protein
MQKLRFTTALAAMGLFAASQAASANPLSPNLDTAKAVSNPIIDAATHAGGGMGGGGHAMSMGGGPHGVGAGEIHNCTALSPGPAPWRGFHWLWL